MREVEVVGGRLRDLGMSLATRESELERTKMEKKDAEERLEEEQADTKQKMKSLEEELNSERESRSNLQTELEIATKEGEVVKKLLGRLLGEVEGSLRVSRDGSISPPQPGICLSPLRTLNVSPLFKQHLCSDFSVFIL